MEYNFKKIEAKWQKKWEKEKIYEVKENPKKDKFYCLIEFPYPSGEGLHVGHPRSYTALDIVARKNRMQGKNVLYPIGWDAFGLPTENYAIKTGIQPAVATEKNIKNFTRQLKSLGFSFDWSREINTTDPEYYKWTQWMFLQFFKHGLAYKDKIAINWCTKCKIGLANEEVVNGVCERCGGTVVKKMKEQWMIKITKYAERLLSGLEKVDYSPRIKEGQINWIGKSEGAEVDFKIKAGKINLGEKHSSKKIDKMFEVLDQINDVLSREKIKVWFNGTFGVAGYYGHVFDDPRDVDCGVLIKDFDKARKIIENLGYKKIEDKENPKFKVSIYNAGDFTLEIGTFDHDLGDKIVELEGYKFRVPEPRWFAECYRITAPKERRIGKNDALRAEFLESISDGYKIKVFTTRPDTLFGATYMVLAPEHEMVQKLKSQIINWGEVEKYINDAKKKSDLERTELQKEKTGVELAGIKAANPVNNETIPIWVADYVLAGYGTGAIMAVPAHDERDLAFAKKFGLSIREVVKFSGVPASAGEPPPKGRTPEHAFAGEGTAVNSGFIDGLSTSEAKEKITKWLEEKHIGKKAVNYKLRDWVFSRQRYWGEPIPLVHCEKCGWMPVEEKDLPVELPKVKKYEPTDTGESPLAAIEKWVKTKCPKCGGAARRETDTMPNWAGSSWYFMRYADPKNKKEFASGKNLKYWMPVDWYNGGMEHTTLHLLYSRFWYKFLYDIGAVPKECGDEPYKKRTSHGLILGEGGEKMSKSRGNVVNPDDIVARFGADTLRVYEMFMGPFEQAIPWDEKGVVGVFRFLERVWKLQEKVSGKDGDKKIGKVLHQTIKKIGEDIETMKFNTAVSALMILTNEMAAQENLSITSYQLLITLLAPFAPHLAEELWEKLGNKKSIHLAEWPKHDPALIVEEEIDLIIQINGKMRDSIRVKADISEEEAKKIATESEKVKKWIDGQKIKKLIFVKGRLVNIVV
ncbi:MAG: leucine--tRNA ligase [Patescibacteria group bacterium]|jgi:leucyl-tRNA synthetase